MPRRSARSTDSTGSRNPRSPSVDDTLTLLKRGYRFIPERSRAVGSDVFDTRLLLQSMTCVTGADAARMFYDGERMQRAGAMPLRVKKSLLGSGSVQGLDGDEHRDRKGMLMSVLSRERVARLAEIAEREWRTAIGTWSGRQVELRDEAANVLCRAVCAWAGVPLDEREFSRRKADLVALFDGAGAVGPRHWRSRAARTRAEKWIENLVRRARERASGAAAPPDDALHTIALHRDLAGELLPPRIAAVELLNILRPTVAVSIYVTFAALALHSYPDARPGGDVEARRRFVHEVRRFYPFFPFAAARVRRPFKWQGFYFPEGRRVLLDLYGTCHDERIWTEAQRFRPERFEDGHIDPYTLIPQGGSDHFLQHRCAGEWATIGLMEGALQVLLDEVEYRVPRQDLDIDLARIPTFPASGFVIVAN